MSRFSDLMKIAGVSMTLGALLQIAFPSGGYLVGALVIVAAIVLEEEK